MAPLFFLEQDTGVEPAFTAWEAVVLPIYESCDCRGIIADGEGKFNHYLSSHFQRKIQQKHGRSSEKNSAMFDMVTNRQIEAISVQNRFSSTRR